MSMRKALILTIVVLLAFAGGCKQNEYEKTEVAAGETKAAQASHQMTPEQLGELGAQIRKDPSRAEALLSQHGMSKESVRRGLQESEQLAANAVRKEIVALNSRDP
jgi:hypothetical protein